MKQPDQDHRQVVSRHRDWLAVCADNFPDARTDDHRDRQRGHSAHRVHHAGTREVRIAMTQAKVGTQLASQPPPHAQFP